MALHNNKNIVELTNIHTIRNHNYHLFFWSHSIFDKEYIAQTGFGKIHYLIAFYYFMHGCKYISLLI